MKISIGLAIAAASSATLSASAQNLISADMVGQALQNTHNGVVHSCGLRVVAVPAKIDLRAGATVFDVSLNISSQSGGTAKLTASEKKVAADGSIASRPLRIYGGWFRAESAPVANAVSDFMPGETPRSLLFAADTMSAAKTLFAMATGKSTQIAISLEKGLERIYFGELTVEDGDRKQFFSCIDELSK